MKNTLLLSTICVIGMTTSVAAFAQSNAAPPMSMQDSSFVKQAAAGGAAEIMMGQLAEKRGMSMATKNFAQMMITDHTKANQQLMQVVTPMGMTPSATPNAMQTMMYQKLEAVPESRFDAMYARVNVRGHEMMAMLFKKEITSGQSPALKTYASQTLPTVEEHLAMAKKIAPISSMRPMSMMKMKGSNADNSADQLNAKELTTPGQS